MLDSFLSASKFLPEDLRRQLLSIPKETIQNITEIRLRSGTPLSLIVNSQIYFLQRGGVLSKNFNGALNITASELKESLRLITQNSLYSHISEIMNGFVSMPYGNRSGVCGIYRDGKFAEVTSINIRIAHECLGVANALIKNYTGGSYLLCGPPASGKTTLLRDFIRGLSNGENGRYYKVSLIDERHEIAACCGDTPWNDVGVNTDIISGRDKALGAEGAIRSMSPDILAFDEIATETELAAVKNSINCGTYIITTAHIGSPEELMKRNVTKELICSVIDKVIFLPFIKAEPIEINVRDGELCL